MLDRAEVTSDAKEDTNAPDFGYDQVDDPAHFAKMPHTSGVALAATWWCAVLA